MRHFTLVQSPCLSGLGFVALVIKPRSWHRLGKLFCHRAPAQIRVRIQWSLWVIHHFLLNWIIKKSTNSTEVAWWVRACLDSLMNRVQTPERCNKWGAVVSVTLRWEAETREWPEAYGTAILGDRKVVEKRLCHKTRQKARRNSYKLYSDLHTRAVACIHLQTHTNINSVN